MKITDIKKKPDNPVTVLQFGEGKFLRAFMEDIIYESVKEGRYKGSVTVVKPRPGSVTAFTEQDCMYTLIVRGLVSGNIVDEKKIITSINEILKFYDDTNKFYDEAHNENLKVIISNTTEAGICVDEDDQFSNKLPNTYPGKLTKFLFTRYEYFNGDFNRGLLVLPMELNENNGELLYKSVKAYIKMWNLDEKFLQWVKKGCLFCNTLVDRIVSGYSNEELEYEDRLIDVCEPYYLLAVETEDKDEVVKRFPVLNENKNIVISDDISIYKERKVKILNGIHTGVSLAAYNAGYEYVREYMNDDTFEKWIKNLLNREIIPTIDMDMQKLEEYAEETILRLKNPFLNHRILDISLNSVAKWKVRILPTIIDFYRMKGVLPKGLVFSLAALINFYRLSRSEGYRTTDSEYIIGIFENGGNSIVERFLSDANIWGEQIGFICKLVDITEKNLDKINRLGIKGAIEELCG